MNKRKIIFGIILVLTVLFAADYFIPIDTYTKSKNCGGIDIYYSLIFGGSVPFNNDKASAVEREKTLDAQSRMITGGCFNTQTGKLHLI